MLATAASQLEWLNWEPKLRDLTEDLEEIIETNAEMSTLTDSVTYLNDALVKALAAGLPPDSTAAERSRSQMIAAERLNKQRMVAETELRSALHIRVASAVQKMIVKAREQRVFEKIIQETRNHHKELQRLECEKALQRALDSDQDEIGALVDQANVLEMMPNVPVLMKAQDLLEKQKRHAFDGVFAKTGGPFGTVEWRHNTTYELCVLAIPDSFGDETVELSVFLIDAGEHDEMAIHVVENDPKIEDLLRGYNKALLPGFSVVEKVAGMEMLRLTLHAKRGKRYFVVPSLGEGRVQPKVEEVATPTGR